MANTIALTQINQDILDEKLEQSLTTGWTTAGQDRVIYDGGNELKIAKMDIEGLAAYSRANGYDEGAVTLAWETHKFMYDRGRKFVLDAMDINEANFIPTAGRTLAEFIRTQVVPEVDLIRIAKMAGLAGNSADVEPTVDNALELFKAGIMAIQDAGYEGQLVAHVTFEFMNLLELRMANQLGNVTFSVSGVDTTFKSIDGVALIPTQSRRMFEKVKADGKGYKGDGKAVHFLIAGQDVPLGIVKHAPARTFAPDVNQNADAYVINYRLYHDLFVEDNKVNAIYVGFAPLG